MLTLHLDLRSDTIMMMNGHDEQLTSHLGLMFKLNMRKDKLMPENQKEGKVLTLEVPQLKTLTVILGVGRGGCHDVIPGSTRMILGIMTRASQKYSEDRVIELTDGYGSILSYVLGSDHAGLRLKTLPEYFDPDFLIDLMKNPLLTDFMVERERNFARQELLQVKSDPFSRHVLLARKNIHAGETIGNPLLGTEESLERIEPDYLSAFHQADFFGEPKLAVICGHAIKSRHVEQLEEGLNSFPRAIPKDPPKAPSRDSPIALKEEQLNQIYMSLALKGPPEVSDNYLPFLLGSHVLGGGGLGNRLGTEIREKRGLAYYAGVLYLKDRTVVDLIAMTFTTPSHAAECLRIMLNEIKRLATEPIPAEELAIHKAEITGQLLDIMDSSSQLATHYFTKCIRQANPDLDLQIQKLGSITSKDIMKTYEALLSKGTLFLTANGNIPENFPIPDLEIKL